MRRSPKAGLSASSESGNRSARWIVREASPELQLASCAAATNPHRWPPLHRRPRPCGMGGHGRGAAFEWVELTHDPIRSCRGEVQCSGVDRIAEQADARRPVAGRLQRCCCQQRDR